uniref:Uncharacterized protein n=1 Tax=Aegilops tauschii subsp. strangulata TaxID=200361 RepID=A0A452Y8G4_AEGTS
MIHQIRKSSEAPRTPGVWRRPQELSPPPEDLLSFAAPRDALNSSVHGEQRAKPQRVQTPNCIRRTIYDVVALDYEKVTVFIDATVVARPNIHLASIRDMRTIVVERPTLEEWRRCVARGVFHSWHRSGIHA